ncbi:MAG: TRAP transporter TatT component family protein [Pyrinomonadaceae bacterium]
MKTKCLAMLFAVSVVVGISAGCKKQSAGVEQAQTAADLKSAIQKTQEADALYGQREDVSKVREGLTLLRQAQLEDSGSYDVAWRLAKFDYYLGSHTTDSDEGYKAFQEGIAAGKSAVMFQANKAEGHFWLGANYGGSAQASTLAGLSDIEDIRQEMETVLKIDEGFQSGSAYMVLGQLYLQAPRLLGGDSAKAVGLLEKGKRFGPTNALLRLHLAEGYHALNRNADARKELNELFTITPDKGFEPEYKEAVAEGHKLLDKLP